MTGSYNETLSGTFARKVRDTIDEIKTAGIDVYSDIFPETKIKYGQASKSLWALQGSTEDNYLATSPGGTATGFGAHYIIIDDIIKNSKEALNNRVLDEHWEWFINTMLSRTEGANWKVILIMTRWAKGDLSGRVIDKYGDKVSVVTYKAVQDDGSMLCGDILSKEDYQTKTKEMMREIVEANYNQQPMDIKGRLYDGFQTYTELPSEAKNAPVYNYTDTADKGADWLCSVSYVEVNNKVYVLDVIMSDEPMEITEPAVARMLDKTNTNLARIESNNGGRGFARNVERELLELGNTKCQIEANQQTANKESRILSSSAWVKSNLLMPDGWERKFPDEFALQLLGYNRRGKNSHDDAPDVLAGIYDYTANTSGADYSWSVIV